MNEVRPYTLVEKTSKPYFPKLEGGLYMGSIKIDTEKMENRKYDLYSFSYGLVVCFGEIWDTFCGIQHWDHPAMWEAIKRAVDRGIITPDMNVFQLVPPLKEMSEGGKFDVEPPLMGFFNTIPCLWDIVTGDVDDPTVLITEVPSENVVEVIDGYYRNGINVWGIAREREKI
jgi:hypothetical protein